MLTGRGTSQRLSHAAQIDNDSLDTVTLAFNLRLETLHFVAVEGIGDIPADIDGSHCCGRGLYDGFTREAVGVGLGKVESRSGPTKTCSKGNIFKFRCRFVCRILG